MCGIVYNIDFTGTPVNNRVLDQFFKQKSRGTDGFGLFDRANHKLVHTPKQKKVLSYIKHHPSTEILFHHRFPTSTDNVKSACHPFSTKQYFADTQYIMVHNGVISNSHTLKAEHEKLGITYASVQADGRFNDSEALLWDLALYLEGKQDKLQAQGSIAFIVMALGQSDKLYFGRNTNPLMLNHRQGIKLSLSSEGQGNNIDPHKLYMFDYTTEQVTSTYLNIPSYSYSGGYTGNYSSGWHWDNKDWQYGLDRDSDDPSYTDGNYATDEFDDFSPAINNSALQYTDDVTITKQDIQTRYNEYLKWNDGYYDGAYTMATNDLDWLLIAFEAMEPDSENYRDTEYEIAVQEQVVDMLLLAPEWDDPNARDPSFNRVDPKTQTVQQLIAAKLLDVQKTEVQA